MLAADHNAVAGSILFPCAARMAAVKARKERVLAYEAELLAVLSDLQFAGDAEAGGGGFGAIAKTIKYVFEESMVEKLKLKHLKEGDEKLICACTLSALVCACFV